MNPFSDLIENLVDKFFSWPALAALLVVNGLWNCLVGSVSFGDYLHFDREDTGPFVIIVGFKFVIAFLILLVYFTS